MQFLKWNREEGEAFLQWSVIGDEMWVHRYELASKHQSTNGNTSLPRTKKFKSVPSASKLMMILFWDLMGPSSSAKMITDVQQCTELCYA
jgi:hypothetical protein